MDVDPLILMRSFPLEDIAIKPGDGRTVEAYLAVFDTDSEIVDNYGHYVESIDRAAFNRAVDHARPQGGRANWKTGVFYNHAMTMHGTPSERFSVPVARTQDIVIEDRGVRVTDLYSKTELADEVLENIRAGAIPGYSFTGRAVRSDPGRPPRGGYRPGPGGQLQRVRRMELGLQEYGPTPVPAYENAGIVAVRSAFARATLLPDDYEDPTTPGDDAADPVGSGTPSDEGPAAEDPPVIRHSGRHPTQNRNLAALIARGIR